VSLVPVPAEQPETTCANCGASLVADQRYCLDCGQPCSPVRLAFLDLLAPETARAGAIPQGLGLGEGADFAAVGYAPVYAEPGAGGWLRRNAGLLSLLSVLLLCLIAGLLVGHWVTQGKTSNAPQVVKIEGLAGLGAASGTSTAAPNTPAASTTPAASKAAAKEEAEEAKAGAKETKAEKAPPPAPVKASPTKLQKLSTTTGKKHQEEINALGAQPIETG